MKKKILIILGTSLYFFSQTIMTDAATYEYDDLGRVTKAVYEDGSSVTYIYDANGNILETVTVSEKEENSGGGQSGEQIGKEGSSGETGKDHAANHDDDARGNHEDAGEKGIQDSHEENGETSKEEEERYEKEGNERSAGEKEEADEGQRGNETDSRAGGIIGAVLAAMAFIWAIFWKKHKKDGEKKETVRNTSEKGGE